MSKRRGSRSSRGKTAESTPITTQAVVDHVEGVRLAAIAWMDEMIEMDRLRVAAREAWVESLRRAEREKAARMEASRHRRTQNRKFQLAQRKAAARKVEQIVVRDRLKITGLPVRMLGLPNGTGAAYRIVDKKAVRIE